MTYRCACGHDYSEHEDVPGGDKVPCDHEDCDCPDYYETM